MAEITRWRPTLSQLTSNSEQIEELRVEIRNEVTKVRSEITELKNELVPLITHAGKIAQNPTKVRIYVRRSQGPFKCVVFLLDASNEQVLEVVRITLGSSDIVAMCDKDQLFLYECGEHFENDKQYYALSQQEYEEFLMKYK